MQAARTVRAELNALLDIASARRPGDQIDRARPFLPRPDEVPAILVARHHLPRAQYDDMSVRQEVEGGRRVWPGHEQQGAGLGHRGEAWGQRYRIVRFGPPAADLQQWPLVPRDRVEAWAGRHDQLGRQILRREVARDLARHI